MKLVSITGAVALAGFAPLGLTAPAAAQYHGSSYDHHDSRYDHHDSHYDSHHYRTHRVCHTYYEHHHRVERCHDERY